MRVRRYLLRLLRLLRLLHLPMIVAVAMVAVGTGATRTSARRRERVLRGAFKFGAFILHDDPPILGVFSFFFLRITDAFFFLWLQREVPKAYVCRRCDVWEYV